MRLILRQHERAIARWHVPATQERHDVLYGHGPEPVVRSATERDTQDIFDLIAASYNREHTPLQMDYWRWKHEANPFGASPCLVAESDGRLVGVRVFLRWNWYSESRCVRAVRAVDTATLPEWRGRGVFSRLTMRLVEQVQKEGVSFIYNTPNDKSMPGYIKMGWTTVTRIPLWIRPIRPSRFARRAFGARSTETPTIHEFGTIERVLNDRQLPAFLADVTPNDPKYHTARTASYLRWRYGSIPGLSYSGRLDISGDAGALVIARGRVRGGLREVTISELLVTPSIRGVQIARGLLADLVNSADADYVGACVARGSAERKALARSGFLPVPRIGPHFTVRRLSCSELDPSQWENWRCSIGDLELF